MGHKVKQSLMGSRIDFFYYAFRNIIIFSLPFTTIFALTLSLPYSSADSSSDTIKLSVPVSCTLASHINTGEEHTISMISGTYEDNIGVTTLTTYCNDPGGFVIYANGNTADTAGNNKLTSILGSTYDIPSGTATSGDTSQWAMKLTAVNSSTPTDTPTIVTGYDSYSAVPNQWTKVVYKDAGTMNVETGSSFTTTYAIYLKGLQPAGTYSGQVKYVMLHPSTTGTPASTINEAFANANKTPVSVLDPETGQTGSFYKMQDMNTGICESVAGSNESTTARLVDIRDNNLYYVTKLDDGHCWMTQNLDLDLSHSTALTSETTDLNDNSLTGAYSLHYSYDPNTRIITWTPENTTRNYNTGAGTAWNNNLYKAYSMDIGEWYWDGNDNTPDCNYLTTACEHFSQTVTTANKRFSVGNYYNWSASIASDDSSSLTASTYNNISNNPQNSICPKGWRLPTISSQSSANEFTKLNILYNEAKNDTDMGWVGVPLYYVRGGNIDSALPLRKAGLEGYYWSSTVYSDYYWYYLSLAKSKIVLNNSGYYNGYLNRLWSIRCLAR
ncbi:hypothetical protein IJJ53_01255 [Candidatus Saccharibacteria bacterium]|nr:hypothetical protein [Candidatus Saccharibacteria bacterium]